MRVSRTVVVAMLQTWHSAQFLFRTVALGGLSATLGVAVSGCSTPQAALDQANHSTKLMSLLEIQVKEFRRVEQASEQAQKDAIAAQREFLGRLQATTQLDAAASKSSGDKQLAELMKLTLADAEEVSANRSAAASSNAAYVKTLAALLKPLPDATTALAGAQAKMAVMGTELDRETRSKELVTFVKEIKKNVEDNAKKIKDAETAAASAAAAAAAGAATAKLP